ncbi:unnamed protein product [Rotaria sp. Silwood2]|nr:unnamed protein product [Rotaria sp. Silwood2]
MYDSIGLSQKIPNGPIWPLMRPRPLQKDLPIEEQRAMGWFKEDGTANDLFKNVEQGASTSVYAALAPDLDKHGGEYLEDCKISQGVNSEGTYWGMRAHSVDMKAAERLWKLSEQMVAPK